MTTDEPQPDRRAPAQMGGSVARGSAWQSLARVLSQAYTVVVSVVAARELGPAGMGSLVFVIYVYTTLVALLAAGLPVATNRFTAELLGRGDRGAIRVLYRWARRVAAAAAALGGGIIVAITLLGAEPSAAWLAAAVACSGSILQTVPHAILLGAQRWRPASVVGLVTGFVGAIVKLGLLLAGGGIAGLLVVDATVAVANLVGATFFARRELESTTPSSSPPDLIRRARVFAVGASASVILTLVVLQRSEVIFLQHFANDVEIALYSISFSAIELLNFIPVTLAIAAASAFATLYGARALDRVKGGYERGIRLVLLLTFPLTAASLALGPLALRLVYGEAYEGTAEVLVVLVSMFPITSLFYLSTSVVQAYGTQRVMVLALCVAAVVNIGLDLALIPSHGAVGAAFANAGAQSLASVIIGAHAARLVGGVRWDFAALLRAGSVSVAAGLAALVPAVTHPGPIGLGVGCIAFLAVFLLGGRVVPVISGQDTEWLVHHAGARLGGRVGPLVRSMAPRPLGSVPGS